VSGLLRYGQYARSKLCNILFTAELQHRLRPPTSTITAYAVHPGVVNTSLIRTTSLMDPLSWPFRIAGRGLALTPKEVGHEL
jgi:NAD(P)-dependent dehydrogenase (short-subunit alcohol dehydrogenase family)